MRALPRFPGPRLARRAAILAWVAIKLILVAAMANRNVAQFIYAGF